MRIRMPAAEAERRAAELYGGKSKPLSQLDADETKLALDPEWRLSSPRVEGVQKDRHRAALRLYVEIGQQAAYPLGEHAFPAVFDFDGGRRCPDKGAIKTFLENGLLTTRMMGQQLIFDLTEAGRAKLDETVI